MIRKTDKSSTAEPEEDILDDRLKNIDREMVRLIQNEVSKILQIVESVI